MDISTETSLAQRSGNLANETVMTSWILQTIFLSILYVDSTLAINKLNKVSYIE